ncbi:MAG TPA: TerB family tellurite resistance protein [Myxococcota bacterium]|nr:TerB family tellurite resistance protein [Myxococcota bacterium]
MSILDFLGLGKTDKPEEAGAATDTIRRIVSKLDKLEPQRARYIASFAYLLSRVANADLDTSPEEIGTMEHIVSEFGGLGRDQAILVVQMAKTHARLFGGTENFLVTREFEGLATPEQKLALLRCLFAVSAADESISEVEDNEIRRIASELNVDKRDYTGLKAEFKDYLAVLKTS